MPESHSPTVRGRILWLSLGINVLSTYLMSVSMGINAIILPLFMEGHQGFSGPVTGIILALEAISALGICAFLPRIIMWLGVRWSLILTSCIRVPALVGLAFSGSVSHWFVLVFLLGLGSFTFMLLLQVWINHFKGVKYRGLMVAMYGTAISIGVATGPFVYRFMDSLSPVMTGLARQLDITLTAAQAPFLVSSLISFSALLPVLLGFAAVPRIRLERIVKLRPVIRKSLPIMLAASMNGVSFYGISWYVVIYGVRNNLSAHNAALLLTAFMMGSLLLEAPLAWLSDIVDRRYVIVLSTFACTLLAVALPIAIYIKWQAIILLFIWGGVVGAVYSVCLTLIGERFSGQENVAANAAFSLMENIGAGVGIILIGIAMELLGTDGFPYIVIVACIAYFTFALSRYRVE